MSLLSGWTNFYVIVGSAAGALVGLQFVAMALIAGLPARLGNPDGARAFATPTVVHFTTVLLLSAAIIAPWETFQPGLGSILRGGLIPAAILLGAAGLAGVLYTLAVIRRMRAQGLYTPVFEDWLFHGILPIASYAAIAVFGCAAAARPQLALFGVAVGVLALLAIGIHNSWDMVTYHVFIREPKQ